MKGAPLLIPVHDWLPLTGVFHWPVRCVLRGAAEADRLPLAQLDADLRRLGRSPSVRIGGRGPAAVQVVRDPVIKGDEHYQLWIKPDGISLIAPADGGAYYAAATLRELLAACGRTIPACVIDDWPEFPRRGVCLDCSRGKVPTVATLKALVERLAGWKVNELQLYVENVFTFRRHPAIGKGYSPFAPADIRSLQDHCKLHHIRLVGALASFGHMERILELPKYRGLSEMPEGGTEMDLGTLCPTDPRSIRFLAELYKEFMPLFEAADFNACCDETSDFAAGRSSRRAKRIGPGGVYLEFVKKIHRLCRRGGKRMNIWADIAIKHPGLLGELPRGVVLLNWEYNVGGPGIAATEAIARAGLPFVVCPGTSSWQTHGTRLANAVANVAQFASAGRRWGAEGLLNTDWGDFGHRNFLGVSLHGLAHGAAHAWNGQAVDNARFTETFCFRVFNQKDDRLASAIRALGDSYRTCGGDHYNSCPLYHALVEPLVPQEGYRFARIDQTHRAGLMGIIERLSARRMWPAGGKEMQRFEALALDELSAAAAMDVLACRRALVAKEIRAGGAVPRRQLLALADGMAELAKRFAALWRARNRPSRLADNLALMRRAEAESRLLARHA